jgi:hypothetical protein
LYREQKERHRRELEREENERIAFEKERERRIKLKNSCPANKVRTYACNEDGERIIKTFSYEYDFDEEKCVESVKKRAVKCSTRAKDDESDDDEVLSYKKYKELKKKHKLADEEEDIDEEDDVVEKKAKVSKKHTKVQKSEPANKDKEEA